MDFEILYDGTKDGLQQQIDKRVADGWRVVGEPSILEPKITGDIEVPQFVYFAQIVVKEPDLMTSRRKLDDMWAHINRPTELSESSEPQDDSSDN